MIGTQLFRGAALFVRLGRGTMHAFSTSNAYIPVRPLKQQNNVLFDRGVPIRINFFQRLIAFTPFLALGLEGLINGWTILITGGTIVAAMFGRSVMKLVRFHMAHQIYRISVNKNLTKFRFTLINNPVSREWEDAIFKTKNTSFQYLFKRDMKQGKLGMEPWEIQRLEKMGETRRNNLIAVERENRKQLTIEIEKSQIKSFSMKSKKEIKETVMKKFRNVGKESQIFEDYNTNKEEELCLVIQTGSIEGHSLFLWANLPYNFDKKHEEYIKALTEGKKIIQI